MFITSCQVSAISLAVKGVVKRLPIMAQKGEGEGGCVLCVYLKHTFLGKLDTSVQITKMI